MHSGHFEGFNLIVSERIDEKKSRDKITTESINITYPSSVCRGVETVKSEKENFLILMKIVKYLQNQILFFNEDRRLMTGIKQEATFFYLPIFVKMK